MRNRCSLLVAVCSLVFAGSIIAEAQTIRQRVMQRFDTDGDGQLSDTERQAMREFLTQRRLDNALNSYPVTYQVGGRQYVAVATNSGGIHTRTMRNAASIVLPPAGATLWVFALPEVN